MTGLLGFTESLCVLLGEVVVLEGCPTLTTLGDGCVDPERTGSVGAAVLNKNRGSLGEFFKKFFRQ